jgi:hypothetical protein
MTRRKHSTLELDLCRASLADGKDAIIELLNQANNAPDFQLDPDEMRDVCAKLGSMAYLFDGLIRRLEAEESEAER